MDQEQIMRIQMAEQEAEHFNKQIELIDQHISEMKEIEEALEKIQEKDTKEILANLGKKIFFPVEIKDKTLIVEVGNKTFVKKSIPETKSLISNQMEKLTNARVQIVARLEELQEEMQMMINEIQNQEKCCSGENHKHDKNHKCKCRHEH